MAKLRKLFSALLLVVTLSLNVIPTYAAEYPKLDKADFPEVGQILTSKIGGGS